MRLKAATACTGALTAAVVFTGSAAYADGITVNPSTARRGDEVTVIGSGCHGGGSTPDTGVTITSKALRTAQDSVTSGRYSVTTSVPWNSPFGRFTVTGICRPSGMSLTGSIFVKWGSGGNPDRWPRTGGGGMAAVAEGHQAPMGGIAGLGGLALMAGAVAVGGFTLVRSRARARGNH